LQITALLLKRFRLCLHCNTLANMEFYVLCGLLDSKFVSLEYGWSSTDLQDGPQRICIRSLAQMPGMPTGYALGYLSWIWSPKTRGSGG